GAGGVEWSWLRFRFLCARLWGGCLFGGCAGGAAAQKAEDAVGDAARRAICVAGEQLLVTAQKAKFQDGRRRLRGHAAEGVILGHVVRYGVGMGEQPGGICIVLVDAVQDALFLVGDAAAGVVGRFVAAGVDAAVGMEAQEQRGFQVVQPGVVFVID